MSHNHYDKNNIHTQSKDTNMHPMTFHFGSSETILFDSWKIDSVFGIFFFIIVFRVFLSKIFFFKIQIVFRNFHFMSCDNFFMLFT